ncbi:MAG: hypothetical protein V8Q88_10565 [Christensenellales bacterium]
MAGNLIDNSAEFLAELERTKARALETIGQQAERYAKDKCPVGTVESTGKKGYIGGTLRNSITHRVDGDVMSLGSNVEYAPYVSLGTGPYFEAPPEWEQFTTTRGSGVGKSYVRPRPYIRPAIEDHREEYKEIMRDELSGG